MLLSIFFKMYVQKIDPINLSDSLQKMQFTNVRGVFSFLKMFILLLKGIQAHNSPQLYLQKDEKTDILSSP
jgi:hypothetical protein